MVDPVQYIVTRVSERFYAIAKIWATDTNPLSVAIFPVKAVIPYYLETLESEVFRVCGTLTINLSLLLLIVGVSLLLLMGGNQ